MHGNVWEWTADAMRSYTTDAQTNPHHPGLTNSDRTVRGGTWNDTAEKLASSFRNRDYPDNGADNRGFRLVYRYSPPLELNSTAPLTIAENQPIGTVVGELIASGLPGKDITYGLLFDQKAKAISAGAGHTVVALEDGTVWSAGLNEFGQLGDGTKENRNKPVQIFHANGEPVTGVKSVLASSWTSTFIMEDGTMWSVGRNNFGQLGNGGGPDQTRPVQVFESNGSAVSDASFGTAGNHHILFVRKDGSLWSFGFNNEGQLGDGTQSSRSYPVAVKFANGTAVVGVRSVSANDTTSLIVLEDGTLWGFGFNGMRQLGVGDNQRRTNPSPVLEQNGSQVVNAAVVGVGRYKSHFARTDGTAWSLNTYAQQNFEADGSPVTGVVDLISGYDYRMFVKEDGTLWGVGDNGGGQLGDKSFTNRGTPVQSVYATGQPVINPKMVSSMDAHTIFIDPNGLVYGFGANAHGNLGNGLNENVSSAVPMLWDLDVGQENEYFSLDTNGTLKTATIFDYENNASTYTIRVQAKDEYNTTVEGNFTVSVEDVFEDLDGDGLEDHLDDDMDGDGFTNDYENEIGSDPMDAQSTPLNVGLVAWYPFDGNASDMSGNGNHGTVNGATLSIDRHGEDQKAYSFDGNDYILVPQSPSLDITEELTLSAWINGGKIIQ